MYLHMCFFQIEFLCLKCFIGYRGPKSPEPKQRQAGSDGPPLGPWPKISKASERSIWQILSRMQIRDLRRSSGALTNRLE